MTHHQDMMNRSLHLSDAGSFGPVRLLVAGTHSRLECSTDLLTPASESTGGVINPPPVPSTQHRAASVCGRSAAPGLFYLAARARRLCRHDAIPHHGSSPVDRSLPPSEAGAGPAGAARSASSQPHSALDHPRLAPPPPPPQQQQQQQQRKQRRRRRKQQPGRPPLRLRRRHLLLQPSPAGRAPMREEPPRLARGTVRVTARSLALPGLHRPGR